MLQCDCLMSAVSRSHVNDGRYFDDRVDVGDVGPCTWACDCKGLGA